MSTENIIKLNIGGAIFHTTKSTLTKFDGFFNIMLETEVPITKDESGAIFIDRDSAYFPSILNFMRDGDVELPKNSEDVKNLQKEAQFYLLEGLVELCQKGVNGKIIVFNVGGTIFHTTRDTLSSRKNKLNDLAKTNESGAIFIDRNPAHFGKILDYMRDGVVALLEADSEVKEIRNEAQFYLLDDLVELCFTELNRRFLTSVVTSRDSYGERLLFADYTKPLITFHVVVKHGEDLFFQRVVCPEGFDIQNFVDRYKGKIDISFSVETSSCDLLKANPTEWYYGSLRQFKKMYTETILTINVGGATFQTSKSTLTRFDGFFKTMLETNVPITRDKSGAIFIDRNPAHFGKILDYMRDGQLNLPGSVEDVKDLQKEAQFYLLDGIVELCRKDVSRKIIVFNVGGTIFHTTPETLSCSEYGGSMLNDLAKTNGSGAIFVDRDPYHFHRILNYMRDGRLELPGNTSEVQEIRTEAVYYRLNGLDRLCQLVLSRRGYRQY